MRDLFSAWAKPFNLIILAPAFPCGVEERTIATNYKIHRYRGKSAFDLILLSMIVEVREGLASTPERFALIGFSGGRFRPNRSKLSASPTA